MKLAKILAALLVSLFALTGCGGPEGTYKLDKEAVKKALEAEIAKKPKEEQAFAGLAVAMIEAMDITLEIKKDGKYDMKSAMPSLTKKDEKKEETETGDWTVDGETITLKGKKELKCKLGSGTIECSGEKDGPALVFKKS